MVRLVRLSAWGAIAFLHLGGLSGPLGSLTTYAHRGTPAIDGIESPDEWSNAEVGTGNLTLPPGLGGGTVSATVLAMTDDFHLHVAVRFPYPGIPVSSMRLRLGSILWPDDDVPRCDAENLVDQSEVYASNGGGSFLDAHGLGCELATIDVLADPPGTNDGAGAAADAGSWVFLESSHDLDSGDDAYDISAALRGHTTAAFYVMGFDGTQTGIPLFLNRRIYLPAEGFLSYSDFEVGNFSEWDVVSFP